MGRKKIVYFFRPGDSRKEMEEDSCRDLIRINKNNLESKKRKIRTFKKLWIWKNPVTNLKILIKNHLYGVKTIEKIVVTV